MRLRAAALVLMLAALPAAAQSSPFIEELTSPEVREAIKAGKTVAIVPIGGTEWNGDHIALGKHNARVKLLAGRIAEKLGNALVAPVIAYVPEGNIDPPTQHMKHVGTITIPSDAFEKTLASTARSLQKHGFRTVVLLGDHGGYLSSLRKVARQVNGVIVPEGYYREMEHAGADDTAAALAVDPRLVRDPKGASAGKGRAALDATVERTVESVKKALPPR
jgi:creatinine amidohydrolase/Fe(II)-dependent formamide hydrolase-like protein